MVTTDSLEVVLFELNERLLELSNELSESFDDVIEGIDEAEVHEKSNKA
jgi:hypothetical protein